MKNIPYSKYLTWTIYLACILLLNACSKSESGGLGDRSQGLIEIAVTGSTFEDEAQLDNRAATTYLTDAREESKIQQSTLELDNGLLLIAQFSPVDPAEVKAKASLKDASRAARDTSDLVAGIRYKVAVYNSAGNYVTERTYIRGQEASTEALLLDGGSTYTFVFYSLNSTLNNLPVITPLTGRTLENSQIALAGAQDFMYRRQVLTVTGNQLNRLNIIFLHRFSQITTTINSAQTGYNITAITSSFQNPFSTVIGNLGTGGYIYSTPAPAPLIFSNLNAQSVTSIPTIICLGSSGAVNYNISSIQIGSVTQTNLTPFTNLPVTMGTKYNLTLNIVPRDEYLTHQGQSAARINGQIWMRHNLGANYNLNPDIITTTTGLIGNYHQWGRIVVAANGDTGTGPISGWNSSENFTPTRWNPGTEANPSKSNFDPCPAGYRIPTRTEMDILLDNTNRGNIGDWTTPSPITSAKVLRSVRNSNVRLTLPAAGNRSFDDGRTTSRGTNGYYWTASNFVTTNGRDGRHLVISINDAVTSNSSIAWAMNVRCIAE